jgi:hypothetical protein
MRRVDEAVGRQLTLRIRYRRPEIDLSPQDLFAFAKELNLVDAEGSAYRIVLQSHEGVEFIDGLERVRVELLRMKDRSGWVLYTHSNLDA